MENDTWQVETCANQDCPRRKARADYLGPRNSIMIDAPDRPSFSVCSWSCLVVVAQSLSAKDGKQSDHDGLVVEDGFGTVASSVCPDCGCRAVYVCRPGDIRCGVCYDHNPKEYYTDDTAYQQGY